MSFVSIEKEACTGCGICVLRCPLCFVSENGNVSARAREDTCNLCGHCVALCPSGAIVHQKMDMGNFIEIEKGTDFDPQAFMRFIRERRSHRHFKDKPIPRDTLETLVDLCRYAPTGGNFQDVEVIVVQDPKKRQKLSDLTVDFFIEMGSHAEKQSQDPASVRKEDMLPEGQVQSLIFYKARLARARAAGFDPILYKAPAVIIFHADSQARTPKDDCVIAATTMSLTARTMGIESTYIGLLETAARMAKAVNEELQLPQGHNIYSVLVMGYPKLKFLKTVDRTPIKTRWE